jgi:antitoxin YefM
MADDDRAARQVDDLLDDVRPRVRPSRRRCHTVSLPVPITVGRMTEGDWMARILAMETTSLADAKNRLSELVAAVEGTWERILITKNGKPAAVLIAPDDLESLLETLDVLTDAETMAAIKEAEDPATRMYTLEEVEAAMQERRQRDGAA